MDLLLWIRLRLIRLVLLCLANVWFFFCVFHCVLVFCCFHCYVVWLLCCSGLFEFVLCWGIIG